MKKALLVEDDPIVARLTRVLMTRMGWETDWVETGRRAIETISARRYGLVVLDLGLPDIGGAGVLRWLRHFEKDRGVPRLPVLVASASEDRDIVELDVDGVLHKPVAMVALEEALRQVEGLAS